MSAGYIVNGSFAGYTPFHGSGYHLKNTTIPGASAYGYGNNNVTPYGSGTSGASPWSALSSSSSSSSSSSYKKKLWGWLQDAMTKMEGHQEQANTEMRDRQEASETLFADLFDQYKNDPMFQTMKSGWEQWMKNPGVSDATRQRLEAQTLARASADAGAGMNSARRMAASQGMSGGAASALQDQTRSAGAANANSALTDLSWQMEQQRMADRQNALGYGMNLYNGYYSGLGSLGSQYANIMGQWQPAAANFDPYSLALSAYGLL